MLTPLLLPAVAIPSAVFSVPLHSLMTPEQTRQTINSVIFACYTAGGGRVELPAGTWVINGAVIPLPKVHLQGAGRAITTLKMDKDVNPAANSSEGWGNNANCINVQPRIRIAELPVNSDIVISDITVDFNCPEILATGAFSAAWAARLAGASLDNVGNGIAARGIDGDFLSGVTVRDCRLINAAFHGTAIYMNSKNIIVTNNYFENNGFRACHIHGDEGTETVENIIVTNNIAVANGVEAGKLVANAASLNGGLYVFFHNAKRGIIANNIVELDQGVGIHAWGNNAVGATSDSLVISGNVVERCAVGMTLGNAMRGASITGNVIANSRSAASGAGNSSTGRGIVLSGQLVSYGINISSNTIHGCDGQALRVENVDGLSITGNTITENNKTLEAQAVILQNVRNATMSGGNTVYNNGRIAFDFCHTLVIEGTVVPNSTETAGTDNVTIAGNYFSGGQRGNAPTILVSGGTAAAPNCRGVTIQSNKIRRPKNASGNVVDLTAQVSRVMYNDILTGTVLDKMTPGSTNLVTGNY